MWKWEHVFKIPATPFLYLLFWRRMRWLLSRLKRLEVMRPFLCREELIRTGISFDPRSYIVSAGSGSLEKIELFIGAGIDVNTADETGERALIVAAHQGREELVRFLLRVPEIDLNADNQEKDTPLIVAARSKHCAIVAALLAEPRVNVNLRNRQDESAWIAAVKSGTDDIERLFQTRKDADDRGVKELKARLQLEKEKRFDANTFVSLCAHGEHDEVSKFLLAGMDVNVRNDEGQTALLAAASLTDPGVVDLLLEQKNVDVNISDKKNGNTPLMLAVLKHRIEVVKSLLGHPKIKADLRNNAYESALLIAAREGFTGIVELLEAKGAVEADLPRKIAEWKIERLKLPRNERTFFEMVRLKRLSETALFLDAGIDVNSKDRDGNTALHLAAANCDLSMVELLLEDSRRTDVNAKDDKLDTPLIVAARRDCVEVVRRLLEKNADVNARNNKDESALLEAARREFSAVVNELQTTGKAEEPKLEKKVARWQLERDNYWSEDQFIDAVWRNNEALVRKFLLAGMDVNARDDRRETGLIAATRNNKSEMVKLLLQQPRIDIEARNAESATALEIAEVRKFDEIVKLLLDKSAKSDAERIARRNIREAGLRYAPEVFVLVASQGQLDRVIDFLNAGMHSNAEDDKGRVALIEATKNGHKAVVEKLLAAGADLNLADRFGTTAREVAESSGYQDIADLLARAGGQSPEPSKNNLIAAVDLGDAEAVKAALAEGASANTFTDSGRPVLVEAILRQSNEIIAELLKHGARVNARDREQMTSLMHAAELGYVDALRILLASKEPGLDDIDSEGRTALILAAWQGRTTTVKMLLEAGANAQIRDHKNRTALIAAKAGGHDAIVKILQEAGAHAEKADGSELLLAATRGEDDRLAELVAKSPWAIEVSDNEGNTPLALAAAKGWTRSIETLLAAHAQPNVSNNKGDTPLMLAARAGRVEAVKQLLAHPYARVLANATNHNGETALLQAAIAGRGLVVELLAPYSDQPDLGAGGRTPLVEMCYHGDLRAVAALIKVRADVNQQQVTRGKSPLMTAMLAGHTEIVQMLKDNGAWAGEAEAHLFFIAKSGDDEALRRMNLEKVDLNARDAGGWTPLMVAAHEGHDGVVKLLLENAADADLMEPEGRETALQLAASKGRAGSLALLIEKTTRSKSSDSSALIAAATANQAQAVRLLVEVAQAPVDGLEGRKVPLVEAAGKGHLPVVKMLLDLGADIHRTTRQGVTALSAALLNNREAVVHYLLEHGAQGDDEAGLTDVQLLIAAAKGDAAEVERLLALPVPPRLDARDDRGCTALMRACEKRAESVVELLLRAYDSKSLKLAIMDRDFALRTPLMWAAIGGSPAIVERLLQLKADGYSESKKKRTALMDACKSGRLRTVELLLDQLKTPDEKYVAVNHQDDDGNSPLSEALAEPHGRKYEYARIVSLLESHGAVQGRAQAEFIKAIQQCDLKTVQRLFSEVDFSKLRHKGRTPLMLAVEAGCKEVVAFLLDKHTDVDERGPADTTALILCAKKASVGVRDEEIVRLLLKHHADYDWTDADESSALLYAVRSQHERIVKDLTDEGANVNQRDRTGASALSLAVEKNNPRLVHMLLGSKRKLDTEVWTSAHRTALTLARLRGKKIGIDEDHLPMAGDPLPADVANKLSEIETMLVQAHARKGWNEAELLLAIKEGDMKWARQLLTKASVHTQDLEGNSPLFLACAKNELSLAKALLKQGASAEVRNNAERTPLMEAAKNGNLQLVKELLDKDKNLDLDAQDVDGQSALLDAARAGAGEIVNFLIQEAADVKITNRSLSTPLIEIARHPQPATVHALLARGANACARTAHHRTAVTEAAAAGQFEVLEILLRHLKRCLANQQTKFATVINAVDDQSRTAFDWANTGSHAKCAELLNEHGAKSVNDTPYVVFTTPHGRSYHSKICPHLGDEGEKKLTTRLLRVALSKGYELCRTCKPGQASIDWNC